MERRLRVNELIRAHEVRVIDPDGKQLGIMPLEEARQAAAQHGLDLIEVAPEGQPPVCRIMDYGKFRYQQRRKQRDAMRKSRQTETKTIRVRPNTDDHDIAYKTRMALKFLRKGYRVKFNVIFRGPEMRHTEIGRRQLQLLAKGCEAHGTTEQAPRMEMRNMTMLIVPRPHMPPEEVEAEASDTAAEADQEPQNTLPDKGQSGQD